MKKLLLAIFVILWAPNVWAQAPTNHWGTPEECNAAVEAPFYFPQIKNCKIDKKQFLELGLPSDSCVLMDLPDRLAGPTGYGWVKLEKGRRLNYSRKTGAAASLAECCNNVKEIRPITPMAPQTAAASAGSAPSADLPPTSSMKLGAGEGIIIPSRTQTSGGDGQDKKKSSKTMKIVGGAAAVATVVTLAAIFGGSRSESYSCAGYCLGQPGR